MMPVGFSSGIKARARRIRALFWRVRLGLLHLPSTVVFGGHSSIARDLCAGQYVYIGPGCEIGASVSFGDYTMIGPGVRIVGNDHVFDGIGIPIIFSGRPAQRATTVGKDAWIGAGAIVMRGIRVGDCAIVGAGSVVTKDVEPFTIVGGVPARVIGMRFESEAERRQHIEALSKKQFKVSYARRLA